MRSLEWEAPARSAPSRLVVGLHVIHQCQPTPLPTDAALLESFPAGSLAAQDRAGPEGFPVQSLFPHELFTGFGPSRIHPAEFAPLFAQVSGRRTARLRVGVRAEAP